MARQDQIVVVGQFADALESVIHPRQIVVGCEWDILLKVVIIMGGIRGHHSLSVLSLYCDDLHAGRMPSHFVDADARDNLFLAVDKHDPSFVVKADQR